MAEHTRRYMVAPAPCQSISPSLPESSSSSLSANNTMSRAASMDLALYECPYESIACRQCTTKCKSNCIQLFNRSPVPATRRSMCTHLPGDKAVAALIPLRHRQVRFTSSSHPWHPPKQSFSCCWSAHPQVCMHMRLALAHDEWGMKETESAGHWEASVALADVSWLL